MFKITRCRKISNLHQFDTLATGMCRDGGGRWVSPQGFALHQLEPLLLTWLQYPAHQETTLLATHLTPPIIITIVMVALDAGDDEMKQLLFSGQCKLFDQKQKTDIGANGR